MARNDTRLPRTGLVDRALLRAQADSWRALASATVALALVVALIVSVLTLLEAVFSDSTSVTSQRSPVRPESQGWRAGVREPVLISKFCARRELASCFVD